MQSTQESARLQALHAAAVCCMQSHLGGSELNEGKALRLSIRALRQVEASCTDIGGVRKLVLGTAVQSVSE